MHDIAVFGASGFVGRLVVEYLAGKSVDLAVAGRSPAKLEHFGLPIITADATDPASLGELARSARVVATTVGPYRTHGLKLVDACIEAGTHYVDLTGEVLFVRESITRHERARGAGVRIIHGCGFDAVPSDLGVLLLHDAAGELGNTTLVVKALRGGLSGGTLASIKGQIEEMTSDPQARKIVADPYALGGSGPPVRDLRRVVRDPNHGWVGPFVMASYNTRIVRRSHGLLDYGPRFAYREVSAYKTPAAALTYTAGIGALAAGLALKPTRALLDRLLPEPGKGPSEATRAAGHFTMEVHGAGHVATVAATQDPGYGATAVMLGEGALALAQDNLLPRYGVLTPAAGIGMPLVERLRAAGMTLEVRHR